MTDNDNTPECAEFLNALAALEKPDGVVGFPTDTVYGLGCLPDHEKAVEKIYTLKGRSETKPLILMSHTEKAFTPFLGKMSMAQTRIFEKLAKKYWPGALTIVVPKSTRVPNSMTQDHQTVGIRVPDCKTLFDLFEILPEGVLATTSANLSGKDECRSAGEVFATFGSKLDYLLAKDGLGADLPSTVCRIEQAGDITILRQGAIVLD